LRIAIEEADQHVLKVLQRVVVDPSAIVTTSTVNGTPGVNPIVDALTDTFGSSPVLSALIVRAVS